MTWWDSSVSSKWEANERGDKTRSQRSSTTAPVINKSASCAAEQQQRVFTTWTDGNCDIRSSFCEENLQWAGWAGWGGRTNGSRRGDGWLVSMATVMLESICGWEWRSCVRVKKHFDTFRATSDWLIPGVYDKSFLLWWSFTEQQQLQRWKHKYL